MSLRGGWEAITCLSSQPEPPGATEKEQFILWVGSTFFHRAASLILWKHGSYELIEMVSAWKMGGFPIRKGWIQNLSTVPHSLPRTSVAATYLVPSASPGIHTPVGFLVLDSLCIFLLCVSLGTFSLIHSPTGNKQRELVGILRKRNSWCCRKYGRVGCHYGRGKQIPTPTSLVSIGEPAWCIFSCKCACDRTGDLPLLMSIWFLSCSSHPLLLLPTAKPHEHKKQHATSA